MSLDHTRLRFGPYVTPVVIPETFVECELRGLVKIVGATSGPIPWPLGEKDGTQELIVFKALARALRQESERAVAEAWGISLETAARWKSLCHRPRTRKKQTRTSPPIPWKPAEDQLLSQVTLAEAARQTGRTITAVRKRRRFLGLPDGRLAAQKVSPDQRLVEQAVASAQVLRQRKEELARSLTELHATYARAKANVAYWRSHVSTDPASVEQRLRG